MIPKTEEVTKKLPNLVLPEATGLVGRMVVGKAAHWTGLQEISCGYVEGILMSTFTVINGINYGVVKNNKSENHNQYYYWSIILSTVIPSPNFNSSDHTHYLAA